MCKEKLKLKLCPFCGENLVKKELKIVDRSGLNEDTYYMHDSDSECLLIEWLIQEDEIHLWNMRV